MAVHVDGWVVRQKVDAGFALALRQFHAEVRQPSRLVAKSREWLLGYRHARPDRGGAGHEQGLTQHFTPRQPRRAAGSLRPSLGYRHIHSAPVPRATVYGGSVLRVA